MRAGMMLALSLLATAPATAEELRIGAVIPLSGASATVGEDQRRGMELALEEINGAGGVLGSPVKLIVEDSGGNATSALSAAKKLVSVDKISAVIGEYSSGVTIPIGKYLAQEGKIHINIGSSSSQIRQVGGSLFSLIGLDDVSSKFAAADARDLGWKKIVVIAPNNAYGQGMADEIKRSFEKLGGVVLTSLLYTEGQSSYRRELQQAASLRPDAYFYTAYGKEAATINREAYELGLNKTPWYAGYITMCTSDSDKAYVAGQDGMDINFIGPNGKAYEAAYRKKYGAGFKTAFSGYGYDAAKLLAAAATKAGSADPAAMKAALVALGKDYPGATGEITFDSDLQRSDQPYLKLKIAQDGALVER